MPRTITTTSRLRRLPVVLVGVLLLLLSLHEPIHGLSYQQQQQPATQDHRHLPPSSSVRLQVYYDSSQGLHRDLYYHPEQPARITQCLAAIRGMALTEPTSSDGGGGGGAVIQLIDCTPAVVQEETIQESSLSSPLRRVDHGGYTTTTTTRRPEERRLPITADELAYAEQLLLRTHAPELVHNLKQKSRQAQAERLAKGKPVLGHVSTTS
jgi:hypothetical protein